MADIQSASEYMPNRDVDERVLLPHLQRNMSAISVCDKEKRVVLFCFRSLCYHVIAPGYLVFT